MQPSGARDRVRGAANIAGDERRASGVTGPSADSTQNMSERPSQSQPSSSPPIRRLRLSGVLRSHESDERLWQSLLLRLLFALIYGVKPNFFVEARSLHFTGAPAQTGENCCMSPASICGL